MAGKTLPTAWHAPLGVQNTLIAEMKAYYAAYAEAFHARSGAQIADFYHTPCSSVRADATIRTFQTRLETKDFFQEVADTYFEEGLRRSESRDLEVIELGGRSLLATMDWMFYRSDGTLLRKWRQSYSLVRIGRRWKILLSTFHLPRQRKAVRLA